MKQELFASIAALSVLGLAIPAAAHTRLMSPPPITQDTNAKSGPCGCYFGAAPEDPNDDATPVPCPNAGEFPITVLQAGTELKLDWQETVNHDGSFRIAFSSKAPDAATKADLDAGMMMDLPDENTDINAVLSQMITVPSEPCELCTIQVRQFMMGAATPYYYTCAAVKIVPPASSGSGSGSGGAGGNGAGPITGSGQGAGGSTGAGMADPQPKIDAGCSAIAGSASGHGALAIAAFAAAAMLRRRRDRSRSG